MNLCEQQHLFAGLVVNAAQTRKRKDEIIAAFLNELRDIPLGSADRKLLSFREEKPAARFATTSWLKSSELLLNDGKTADHAFSTPKPSTQSGAFLSGRNLNPTSVPPTPPGTAALSALFSSSSSKHTVAPVRSDAKSFCRKEDKKVDDTEEDDEERKKKMKKETFAREAKHEQTNKKRTTPSTKATAATRPEVQEKKNEKEKEKENENEKEKEREREADQTRHTACSTQSQTKKKRLGTKRVTLPPPPKKKHSTTSLHVLLSCCCVCKCMYVCCVCVCV